MIDKRTAVGKMIDYDKIVYVCRVCGRHSVGTLATNTHICEACKNRDNHILVMKTDMVVVK